jgi:hypothetical protein
MELREFLDKYNGLKVDFDGVYGAQCVDLFRQYCKDVWGTPHLGGVDGAIDLFNRYEKLPLERTYCHKISYGSGMVPVDGDVVVWSGTASNKYGHVAICLYASDRFLVVFEQDGVKQDGAKVFCRSYERVVGWLRKRSCAIV